MKPLGFLETLKVCNLNQILFLHYQFSGYNFIIINSSDLFCFMLCNCIPKCYLAVSAHHDQIATPHRADGGSAILFH